MSEENKNNEQTHKKELESKLQQLGFSESDLNELGYSRNPLLDLLKTPSGEKIVDTVANLLNSFSQKDRSKHTMETIVKLLCITAVIFATFFLSLYGKFEPSVGVLFGSVIGYLFGRTVKNE
jgi:rubrerythrin